MTAKIKSFLFFSYIISINLIGQISMPDQLGPDMVTDKNVNQFTISEVIANPDGGFVIVKYDSLETPTKMELLAYNNNLQNIGRTVISTTREQGFFAIENVIIWNKHLIVLASLYHPGPRKNHLLLYQYSLPDFALKSSKVLMETIAPRDVYVPYFSKLSQDKKNLLVVGWNYTKQKENASVAIETIDESFNSLSESKFDFEYENRRIAIEDLFLNEQGQIFITGSNYRGSVNGPTYSKLLDFFVLKISENKAAVIQQIEKEKNLFPTLKFDLDKNGDLVGMGYWSKGVFRGGFGYFKWATQEADLISKNFLINKEIYKNAFLIDSTFRKAPRYSFQNLEIKELIVKEDALYLVGEKVEVNELTVAFNEIIITKVKNNGQFEWMKGIRKKQNFHEQIASFSLFKRKEKVYFLYNQLKLRNNSADVLLNQLVNQLKPTIQIIDLQLATGEFRKRPLKNVITENHLLLPQFSMIIGREDALLVGFGILDKQGNILLKKVKMGR